MADTGATGHYLRFSTPSANVQVAKNPIRVSLPDGFTIKSSHTCLLNIPELPTIARTGHIFPSLQHHALISIGVLCDAGCKVDFDRDRVSVKLQGREILSGPRDNDRLWRINLPTASTDSQNPQHSHHIPISGSANLVMPSTTIADTMRWFHGSLFSPVISTLKRAIANNHFATWPMFTVKNVTKHLEPTIATAMGHLDQSRKDLPEATSSETQAIEDAFPGPIETDGVPTEHIFAAVVDIPRQRNGTIHSDQTGKFDVPSIQGNLYTMLVYCYDANAILVAPMKSRAKADMLKAYKSILQRLIDAGLKPSLQRLDNECSDLLKQYMKSKNIDYQLVAPGMHRQNAAERAIRTFPLNLWDLLLEQAEDTLNMLRSSRLNPKLSAYAQLHGQFDLNATPIAPPGIKIVTHNKPDKRASWAPHGAEGWYVGEHPNTIGATEYIFQPSTPLVSPTR